ncbi:MAG: YgiQ family radical SAM protein [Oscillospiraceae bacterium]|nr:YgiQ family radical SAM protein [Oscillospiraceae bacterium]
MAFLPMNKTEMKARGWDEVDFACITGDAYVDHPSFGMAILSRLLEDEGYRVGVIAQPDWRSDRDFAALGRPRLGFLINGGNIDSMVAHYTAARRKRSTDAYSPGNRAGLRPDRAVTVYAQRARQCFPGVPVIIGGLEASLRRFAHYDYWDDRVRPSVLVESGADLLSYGMGEHQTLEIARRLAAGEPVSAMTDIRGTCYLSDSAPAIPGALSCASCEKVSQDLRSYAKAFLTQFNEQDAVNGRAVVQKHGERYLVQNPPALPLKQEELDRVFELPYEKYYHPRYEAMGGVPAIEEVEFSIIHNRGCFGNCNFCSIASHQGRRVTCRSMESVLREAEKMTQNPRFKGYIHDVGGPTANFRRPSCQKQLKLGLCRGKKCLAPQPCPALQVDHSEYLELLRRLRALPGVKRVFIRSGIRFDYLMEDPSDAFFEELVRHHVSGQLKVAPEHCSAPVLDKMGKPHIGTYERFSKKFYELTRKAGKEQYLVPYLMSSHPGSTMKDAVAVAVWLKKNGIRPEQVQDFYPTPGTVSTCMFYTGLDPFTMEPVYVPKSPEEKAMQRALLQYYRPENRRLAAQALKKAGREDLIGTGAGCLIPPEPGHRPAAPAAAGRAPVKKSRYSGAGRKNSKVKNGRKR